MNNQIISESDYFAMQEQIKSLKAQNEELKDQIEAMKHCKNCRYNYCLSAAQCYNCSANYSEWVWNCGELLRLAKLGQAAEKTKGAGICSNGYFERGYGVVPGGAFKLDCASCICYDFCKLRNSSGKG